MLDLRHIMLADHDVACFATKREALVGERLTDELRLATQEPGDVRLPYNQTKETEVVTIERTSLDWWIWQDFLNGGYRWTIAEKESNHVIEIPPVRKVSDGGSWTAEEARADLTRRLDELAPLPNRVYMEVQGEFPR